MKFDPNKSPAYVIVFAAFVSAAFTAAIMALHTAGAGAVQRNERLMEEKALVDLFGLADVRALSDGEIARLVRTRIAGYANIGDDPADERRREIFLTDPQTGAKIPLLVAFRHDLDPRAKIDLHDKANILAYALPISGVGFWARIDGWLALTPDLSRTVGIVFLRHSETPGLGGRITESEFRDQFRKGILATPPDGGKYIEISRASAGQQNPRHVDAITGATGTSTAVERFVNRDLAAFHRAATAAGLDDRKDTLSP
ncbi:MAG TPA: FMN-binding protein [Phycisphaerae bacterium]|mgnify:CR=1 FL=1|nr:FMN-binding protein [Phycisphaerae bacterium]